MEYQLRRTEQILCMVPTCTNEQKPGSKIRKEIRYCDMHIRAEGQTRRYGLWYHEYWKMYCDQGGLCKVCRRLGSPLGFGAIREDVLAVDHRHKDKTVRGLLCLLCNVGLGSFRDDPELLTSAIAYLRSYADAA